MTSLSLHLSDGLTEFAIVSDNPDTLIVDIVKYFRVVPLILFKWPGVKEVSVT